MVNVKGRRCMALNCKHRPGFAPPGEKRGQYCAKHKTDDMVDVVSRRCQSLGCNRQPVYGNLGDRAILCGTHKEEGMFDVRGKRCDKPGCTRQPGFGNPETDKGAVRCRDHKLEGMTNVRRRRALMKQQGQPIPRAVARPRTSGPGHHPIGGNTSTIVTPTPGMLFEAALVEAYATAGMTAPTVAQMEATAPQVAAVTASVLTAPAHVEPVAPSVVTGVVTMEAGANGEGLALGSLGEVKGDIGGEEPSVVKSQVDEVTGASMTVGPKEIEGTEGSVYLPKDQVGSVRAESSISALPPLV
ncbi:unnamed protein product [Choristocarpus tenellus]